MKDDHNRHDYNLCLRDWVLGAFADPVEVADQQTAPSNYLHLRSELVAVLDCQSYLQSTAGEHPSYGHGYPPTDGHLVHFAESSSNLMALQKLKMSGYCCAVLEKTTAFEVEAAHSNREIL